MPLRPPRSLRSLSLLSCLALASCAETPRTEIAGASPRDRQDSGTVATVYVLLQNPNNEALPLRTVEYTVELTGQAGPTGLIFRGSRAAEATLSASGSHRLALPAAFPASVDLVGASYTVSGTVGYLQPGQIAAVLYDYRIVRPEVQFSGTGTIAAGDIAPAAPAR